MIETPEAVASEDLVMDDGAVVRLRRHGDPAAPVRLVLSHGNGFAIDGYAAFWSQLLPRADIVLFDLRRHGRNPPTDSPETGFDRLLKDISAVRAGIEDAFGHKPTAGVMHSVSARATLHHAASGAARWDGLVLIDPPMVQPEGYPIHEAMRATQRRLAEWAKTRHGHFDDPSELAAEYRHTFRHVPWQEPEYERMARAVLQCDPTGGWRLACPGAFEASLYLAVHAPFWAAPDALGGAVHLIDAETPRARPAAKAVRAMHDDLGYPYTMIEGAGHMMQVEKPETTLAAVTEALGTLGLAI